MMPLTRESLLPFVAEARLSPSVHNIQPSRWRINGERLLLLGDTTRTIPVADPSGRDWRLSHGAHAEGLSIALARRGLRLAGLKLFAPDRDAGPDGLVPIAEMKATAAPDAGDSAVETRASWRGSFEVPNGEAAVALDRLRSARDDIAVISDAADIAGIASLFDRASLHFLRQDDHRRELLHWMRLSKSHPRYAFDGLNAEAMAMSGVEAWGAGLVLGPLFKALDAIGLTGPLTSEAAKTRSAAAIMLLHRPEREDAFDTGRHFYRAWLEFERAGFKGCPMSVLVDWDVSRTQLATRFAIPQGRRIVGAFRIGMPAGNPAIPRFRLPVEAYLV